MPEPLDKNIAQEVALLDGNAFEFFEERAAIMEYMGRLSREDAERKALIETRQYVLRNSKLPKQL